MPTIQLIAAPKNAGEPAVYSETYDVESISIGAGKDGWMRLGVGPHGGQQQSCLAMLVVPPDGGRPGWRMSETIGPCSEPTNAPTDILFDTINIRGGVRAIGGPKEMLERGAAAAKPATSGTQPTGGKNDCG